MSDQTANGADEGDHSERSGAFESASPGAGKSRMAFGVFFALVVGAAAAFWVFPEQMRLLFDWATSEVEEMQRTSRVEPGLSTAITGDRDDSAGLDVETPPASITVPGSEASSGSDSDPDADRIAALEQKVAELSGVSEDRLMELLDDQEARLRAANEKALADQRRALTSLPAPSQAGFTPALAPTAADREAEAARQRAEEERARRLAIYNEQVVSDGLVYDGGVASGSAGVGPGGAGAGPSRRLNTNERFLASAAASTVETVEATALSNPSRTVVQGTVIEATLETAIDTDLPGLIRAVTSHPVWSYDGETILLPAGSRLIGQYSSDIKLLQSRALIAWNRAITPDGVSVNLGSVGADALGRSGQMGDVDSHFGAKFGTAALISILGAVPVAITGNASTDTVGGDLAADIGDDLRGATSSVLQDYLRVPPTIRIDQGTVMTVFVNRDLIF